MRSLEFPSIQWGLILGIPLSIIVVVLNIRLFSVDYLAATLRRDPTALAAQGLTQCLGYLLYFALVNVASVLASRETGTLGGGMWAAAIADLTTVIMIFVLQIIILPNTQLGNGVNYNAPHFTNGALNAAVTSGCVCGTLFEQFIESLAAAVLAIPGAWFGRWLYERGADDDEEGDDYEEAPYPGMMPGGYPVFPQQGMPPQQGYMPPGAPPQQGGWGGPPPGYAGPPPGYGGPPPGYVPPPPGYGPPPGPGSQGYAPPQPPPQRY